ncbi:hypothetical protein T10_10880 [Trichinella papuae]|uniref:Uncharacterized protein n=1 Tax=Trichinella papuae TaxID=268474 RepID=A0A0V1MU58_9BILA|nr:hypothetical protein T10_12245 [Trichinella papuae]KRZ75313.1 hypothetical protein T10_10880 [Trichinella papuae]
MVKNIAQCTKTIVTQRQLLPLFFSVENNRIAIKRSEGQRHVIYLPQLRWSAAEKASNPLTKGIVKVELKIS